MKKHIYTLILLILTHTIAPAQSIVYSENFDGGSVSMNTVGSPGWGIDTNLFSSSHNSWRGQYLANGTITTQNTFTFNTSGNSLVTLNFKQICKVEFLDTSKIEISVDGGTNWTRLIAGGIGKNCIYNGAGSFINIDNKFSEASYLTWSPGLPTTPNNTWWKQESFDISQLAGNQNNVQIRFVIVDYFSNGMNGRAGWFLDDVNIEMDLCELVPPTISLQSPIISGNIYQLAQTYDIYPYFTDLSGISSGELYWTINSDPTVNQAFGLIHLIDSLWAGSIYHPNGTFADGDTVCYWIEAIDSSGCQNMKRFPNTGCIQFIIHDGIAFPFCDNFDSGNQFWSADPNSIGSIWEVGVPNQNTLNTSHSAPNVLGLSLSGFYLDNSLTYMVSTPFDFSQVSNANLSFWQNRLTENGWDGVNLQYSVDGGNLWFVIGSYPDSYSTNWYNKSFINSNPNEPVWDGQSTGWEESRYKLGAIPGMMNQNQVIFRFKFSSDPSVSSEGFDIDDFCIRIPCNNDLSLYTYITPISTIGLPAGVTFPFTVTIENSGNNPQTTATIFYQVNNGAILNYTWTGVINAGSFIDVTIPTGFTVPASGPFTLSTWINLTGDCDATNDTLRTYLSVIPTYTPIYCNDFESVNSDWISTVKPGSTLITIWELGSPAYGSTNSTHSGINAWDINLNTGYEIGATSYLTSPFFDFSTISAGRIAFALNWYTQKGVDGTHMEFSTDAGVTWSVLGGGSFNNPDPCGKNWYTNDSLLSSGTPGWENYSNGWIDCEYGLCCSTTILNNPNPIQFRFVFTSDSTINGFGVSMDDFCIYAVNGPDISVNSILSPMSPCPSNVPTTIKLEIINSGTTTVTAFDVNYLLNGVPGPTAYNWTGSLPPCGRDTIMFIGVNFPNNTNDLCGFTLLAADTDHSNDTLCKEIIGTPKYIPNYCDDFENGNTGWIASNQPGSNFSTIWELGTPNYGTTNSAHSGSNAWDINLNAPYENSAIAFLTSPLYDFSLVNSGRITFSLNYNTEAYWDGTRLEYSLDNGINWIQLGGGSISNPDPCGVNWYTDDQLNSSNLPAWAGNSGGWRSSEYKLCCINGILNNTIPVQFRFVFTSETNITVDGISMDDFCVYSISGTDIGISDIVNPTNGILALTSVPVIVTLENFGSTTVNSTDIIYSVNGSTPSTFSWTGTLLPCDKINVNLSNYTMLGGSNTICAWTQLVQDVNHSNDTICQNKIGVPTLFPEFTDNFDNGNTGWISETAGDLNTNWEFGTPSYGATTGALSNPTCWDINLNTTYYPSADCYLYSPYFDLSTAVLPRLEFWQNRNTNSTVDGLNIEFSIDGGLIWSVLGVANDPLGINWYSDATLSSTGLPGWSGNSNGWKRCEYDLNSLGVTNTIRFRFRFKGGFSGLDGVSIDNFAVYKLYQEDASLESFINPGSIATSGANIPVEVILKNNGIVPITNLNITYIFNGASPVTFNWAGNLAYGASTNVVLPSIVIAQGTNTIKAYINWVNDLNTNNDTITNTFSTIQIQQLPFSDDFENGNLGWTSENVGVGGTLWEFGTPNYGATNSTYSGFSCWDINLTTPYGALGNTRLYSPYFDLSQSLTSELSFWLNYESEFSQDGLRIEYTTNGNNWAVLGTTSDPNGVNWYNNIINPQSKPGWSGNSGGWKQSSYNTQALNGNSLIQFRFIFTSDITLSGSGFSMDDFSITQTVGINEINGNDEILIYPNPVHDELQIELTNKNAFTGEIIIYDAAGKVITVKTLNKIPSGSKIEISTKGFAPGMYLISIDGEQTHLKKTFIKD